YVKLGWCFVAEKAKVGGKTNVDPKPRMKGVDTKLPSGSTFDGHVQAMAFRFKVDKLILPMRLSAYNEGEMHNIVYLLTDGPRKIRTIPEEYVVRQLSGQDLFRNVTQPPPLRIIGGDFPREVVGAQNLMFGEYHMPARRNHVSFYDAKGKKPGGKVEGVLHRGATPGSTGPGGSGTQPRGPGGGIRGSALPMRGV